MPLLRKITSEPPTQALIGVIQQLNEENATLLEEVRQLRAALNIYREVVNRFEQERAAG